MFIITLLNRGDIFLSKQDTNKQHNHISAFLKLQIWGYHHTVYEAGSCQSTKQPTWQNVTSMGPLMEITQITIPVSQVRLHVLVFQTGKQSWAAKSGHWGKGKPSFYVFSLIFHHSPCCTLPLHLIPWLRHVSEPFMNQLNTLTQQQMTAGNPQIGTCSFS